MRKLISYVSILLFICLCFIGCGKNSEPAQTSPSSSAQNTKTDPSSVKPSANSDNLGAKLSTTYAEMMKNNKYLMKYKMTTNLGGQSMEIESTLAVSGKNMAVTTLTSGMETTIITKDEKTYMVNHAAKTVMVIPQSSATKNSKDNEINTNGLTYVNSGTEDGLSYEKYSTTAGTMKYYFNGQKLVKISIENEGHTMVMSIIEMSNNVTDSMFEIPADYQTTQLTN